MTTTNGDHKTLEAALAYLGAGLSVVPIMPDGSKRPSVRWALYATGLIDEEGNRIKDADGNLVPPRLATEQEVRAWFKDARLGVGVVGGKISGNLEHLDFDSKATEVYPAWGDLVEAEAPGLLDRLSVRRTPSGGYHVSYRCPEVEIPGNAELAIDPSLKKRILIETRGEGGQVLAPGTPGHCHETGRLYEHISGPRLSQVGNITSAERAILWRSARAFDLSPPLEPPALSSDGHLRPGDDFAARGPDWPEIIGSAGWVEVRQGAGKRFWRRPGKEGSGWSATTGCTSKSGQELFCVFSSNAPPFPGPGNGRPCSSHSKFNAYALLHHGGDHGKAAKALAAQGYGEQKGPRATFTPPGPDEGASFNSQEQATPGPKVDTGYRPPRPRKLSELVATDPADRWLCWGLVARLGITMLTALWKSGKTTALAHLLRAMAAGGEWLGQAVVSCSGLVVSEESDDIWAERRDALGIGDHIEILNQERGKFSWENWPRYCKDLGELVRGEGHKLVMFDAVANFWPVADENNSSEMIKACGPLRLLNDAGAGVLLFHHPRKSDGQEGTSSRGSGALPAFCDILLELRRHAPMDKKSRKRVLTGLSRYRETPEEIVAELSEDGLNYVVLGTAEDVTAQATKAALLDLLPMQMEKAVTVAELAEKWSAEPKPSEKTIRNVLLNPAYLNKDWCRRGGGKKGDPHRFWRLFPETGNAGNARAGNE